MTRPVLPAVESFAADVRELNTKQEALRMAGPALRLLAQRARDMQERINKRAAELDERLPQVEGRANDAFDGQHKLLDATESAVKEIEQFASDLERMNNQGNSSGSSTGSG